MASTPGSSAGAVEFLAQLERDAPRLDFFAVVRRLEALYPEAPGFGRSLKPADDPVRLGQEPSLKFAPGMLASFRSEGGGRPWLRGYFFGLFGPNGPLPLHITEHALQRKLNEGDPTLARFADMFHHRMLSLLYRAWATGRPTVSADRPADDAFASRVAAQFGLREPSLRNRDALPDRAKLHYAGILALQTRNAEGLRIMAEDFFRIPVRVAEFVGAWMRLPHNCRLLLGLAPETGTLGQTAVLGAEVWGCQQRFRLELGPLSFQDFRRFLPGGLSLERLKVMVRNYLGDEKDWDVRLTLHREQMPPLKLGQSGELGWTTWLRTADAPHDLDELVLTPLPA